MVEPLRRMRRIGQHPAVRGRQRVLLGRLGQGRVQRTTVSRVIELDGIHDEPQGMGPRPAERWAGRPAGAHA
jgi:hypothetical protein